MLSKAHPMYLLLLAAKFASPVASGVANGRVAVPTTDGAIKLADNVGVKVTLCGRA